MYPTISPSCTNIQTLHDELLEAISKVQSVCEAIEAAHGQLSAIYSGQSWLSEQGIPQPPMPELNKVEGELVFAHTDLTLLIHFGYQVLKNLEERFEDLQSEPL
jgi:hypothetical protein